MIDIRSKLPIFFGACRRLAVCGMILTCIWCPSLNHVTAQDPAGMELDINELKQGKAFIYQLHPADNSGKGYKLVYMVAAPLAAYWNFKIDFKNDFLLTNKLILDHRLVSYQDNTAITETVYASKPGVKFRWRTTVLPAIHRLDFELLNPEECGEKFHYGHIQLEAAGDYTQVTQTAYFDFFGATFWMNYPWYGGMIYNLRYTARWEQETIIRLIDRYR